MPDLKGLSNLGQFDIPKGHCSERFLYGKVLFLKVSIPNGIFFDTQVYESSLTLV